MNKEQLISHLKGFTNSLENDFMDVDAVINAMIILAHSHGTLILIGETYFKPITKKDGTDKKV